LTAASKWGIFTVQVCEEKLAQFSLIGLLFAFVPAEIRAMFKKKLPLIREEHCRLSGTGKEEPMP
jgi:hypothetical protein